MIALHLSANSHHSRQEASFSCRVTSLLQMSQTALFSSLQISTLPAQFGHIIYSGLGRRNFLIPGHDSELGVAKFFSSPVYAIFSPFILIVSCLTGIFFPESSKAS